MEKFGGSQESPVLTKPSITTKQSTPIELPASYGRALPISEEEISAINVSVHQILGERVASVCMCL